MELTETSETSAGAATATLVDELKALTADTLAHGIERMFDGADDLLFEMARRAANNKDQRIYFDTMRIVRLGRARIAKNFREQILRGFEPEVPKVEEEPAADIRFENLSLQESRSLEESIAVSAMANKAENLYGPALFEIRRRMEWLIRDRHVPINASALLPSTISSAFRHAAEALEVEFDIELVIFKLFDRLVLSDLGELYQCALAFFDQHGIKPAAFAAPGSRAPDPAAMAGAGEGAGMHSAPRGYGFAQPPMMDAATLNVLRSLGSLGLSQVPAGANAGGYYGDVQLGADLATAAVGEVVPGWEAPRAYAYVQRAGAVGQMFNDLLQDPTLPSPLKPRFDQLRFTVIKSALRDAGFFADHQHPVRGLMNELATLAAASRASGMEALRRIEELVAQIQLQFDVAAEDVRSQTTVPGAVDEKTLEAFFAQQKEEAARRRQAIIERTRRVVAEELQLQTLARRVPETVWPLLNSGWAPLTSLSLLKHGGGSDAWRDAMHLLVRILDSIDPRRPAARGEAVMLTLEHDLQTQLSGIGMKPERVAALLRSWREGVATIATAPRRDAPRPHADGDDPLAEPPVEAPLAGTAASPEDPASTAERTPQYEPATLLELLMGLSSWFRVYDHERDENRWLKLVSHSPADDTVTFAEFAGQNRLEMSAQTFLDDLVAGRAEPIDLGPAARRSFDGYLDARRRQGAVTAQAA